MIGPQQQAGEARNRVLILVFVVAAVVIVGMAVSRHLRAASDVRLAAERAALEERQRADEARQSRADAERRQLEDALAAQRQQSVYVQSFGALDEQYRRWKDAAVLADSTARMSLSGSVATLQAIRRETEALTLPPCLADARQQLVKGMTHVIDGFVAFLRDASIGKLVAQAAAGEAREAFAAYETAFATCPRDQ